ncbi:MAG: EamA family transporter [Proteobacteria bacterium]|nr:EamA family transporter [Pseudomonadota bacterium]MBI3498377.1 EamA family transporter [Pseudomonadota bacterium]
MRPRDLFLAALVPTLWGLAFIAIKVGLETFTPAELVALRFLIAALPALFLARPAIAWPVLFSIGLFLFSGQFLLLFFGIAWGMPTGLASVVAQTQAFFTVLFAALVLGEHPSLRQSFGMLVALLGLVFMGFTVGGDFTAIGFAFTLAGAVSWAIGNVLVKRQGKVDMLALMAWASLVPVALATALSLSVDGAASFPERLLRLTWPGFAAVLYLGVLATVLTYVVWAGLLSRYSAATVAPFTLFIPFVGALSSWLVFGERFGPLRLAGMALVIAGVAVVVAPVDRLWAAIRPRPRPG